MIQAFTEYVADQLSLTLGTNIFSRTFPELEGTLRCLYDGRYGGLGTDGAELTRKEIIAEARAKSPADAEEALRDICSLFLNKSNINIPNLSKYVTVTGSVPRQHPDKDDKNRFRYIAELVVTYK